jgi:hypothetical protein
MGNVIYIGGHDRLNLGIAAHGSPLWFDPTLLFLESDELRVNGALYRLLLTSY